MPDIVIANNSPEALNVKVAANINTGNVQANTSEFEVISVNDELEENMVSTAAYPSKMAANRILKGMVTPAPHSNENDILQGEPLEDEPENAVVVNLPNFGSSAPVLEDHDPVVHSSDGKIYIV